MEMTLCPSCGASNREGGKFCSRCGTSLASGCPACGAQHEPGDAFCAHCGTALGATAAPGATTLGATPVPPQAAPTAERRLVSVLFADLVGFTTLSENRDSEDVRELLSRYFDTCRRLIELYGGTVEKFIGDAVMAVWGTPTATEDDAERAVRAALDLVAAVSALGDEVGAPELRARAGVLTGEAAVTIGAEGQGMVAGDLVNTASRVQSAADPGTVFVGEATRRSTEQTVIYEDVGSFELKGKEGLTPLWRAQRVVSGLRGSLKSQGLEAPFVGRDRELRQIKDLFHAIGGGAQGPSRLRDGRRRHRQVAPGVGVLQVLRRHRRDRLLAPRALPLLRRGRDVLGARRHGAHALPHLGGGGACVRAGQAARHARGAHPRQRGAGLSRAAACPSAGAGRVPGPGPAGPLRRMASVLRAPGRELSDGARLRGHAVGRREPARLRRVPARLVAQPPDLRGHACAARTARAETDLGGRATELHVALPGAARPAGDGRAPGRSRAGASPGDPRPHPRARRGHPALRGRNGAHAARSRPARPGGLGLHVDGTRWRSSRCRRRCTLSSPRGSMGCLRRSGGCCRTRPSSARRSRRTRSPHSRLPRATSRRCSPPSRAKRCSACRRTHARRSTASTAFSRTSCATSPTRRSRSASAAPGTSRRPRT